MNSSQIDVSDASPDCAEDPTLQSLFDQIGTIAAAVDEGDVNSATDLLNDLLSKRDSALFQELGRMTRQLHDSMRQVGTDDRTTEIAQTLLPDTQNRLAYVLEKTEEAADQTLTAVEHALPITERLTTNAKNLDADWQDQSSVSPAVHSAVAEFLSHTSADADRVRSYLNDALMAQSYQDLTGQVLRSMMTVMQELETRLVGLIREHGSQVVLPAKEPEVVEAGKAYGPQVDGDPKSASYVSGQDEVDDLLASLGF